MHFKHTSLPKEYQTYTGRKILINFVGLAVLGLVFVFSMTKGAVKIPVLDIFRVFLGRDVSDKYNIIIYNIRMPQALAAIAVGIGLSVCGVAMQSILRNPLGSPFTLGISHAAAFGAAFSVMFLGAGIMLSSTADAVKIINPYITSLSAFIFSLLAAAIIMIISRIRRASTEVIILTGVALAAFFTAATMFLQYFADDVQLAAMVFWTFGDLSRASWSELTFISIVVALSSVFFYRNRWNYNAIDCGEDTAKGLGVKVEGIRLYSMLLASLVTAVIMAFLGIIGFIGLVCPHIARRIIGNDHRFLIPFSCIVGGILLLTADTFARTFLSPHVLPVSILTAFCGVPVFLWLIVRGYKR